MQATFSTHLRRRALMAIVFVGVLVTSFFAVAPSALACHSQIAIEKLELGAGAPGGTYTIVMTDEAGHRTDVEVVAGQTTTIDQVPPGTYWLEELNAPADVTIEPNPVVVTDEDDQQTIGVLVTNPYPAGKLAITKIETGATAPGGTYTFDIAGPGDLAITATVAAGDTWTSDWLPLGTYTITERDAPAGHTIEPNPVALTDDGATVTVTATNPYRNLHGKLAITKIETGNVGPAGTFTMDVTGPVSFTATVRGGDTWTSDWLPLGTYTITERDAPDGHTITPNPVALRVDGVTVTVVVRNPTLLGSSGVLPATGGMHDVVTPTAIALIAAGAGLRFVSRRFERPRSEMTIS